MASRQGRKERNVKTDSSSPGEFRSVDPRQGVLHASFPLTTDHEVNDGITRSHDRYLSWRDRSIEHRAAVVQRVAEALAVEADHLAHLVSEEMGKNLAEALEEIEFSIDILDYYATKGPEFAADQAITTFSSGAAVVEMRPVGALLGVMPWNYPVYKVARFIGPNLVLGNTVIIKHAESVPRTALALEHVMREAGVPEGAYVSVFASHAQVQTMIADDRVRGVSFTGSPRAGASIGASAGRSLKKCVLELGGSDAYILLDTDDATASADVAWNQRLVNLGQTANSNKRMIVMDFIYEEFVARLVERAVCMVPGDPLALAVDAYGPMGTRGAADLLYQQIEDARSHGACVRAGGTLAESPSAYFQPAVLTDVTPEMRAYHEELFGPVAVVYSVSDDDEAVRLANDTPYGLGAAVFSHDETRAKQVADKLEVGMANINAVTREGAEVPFGGVKRSGFGRELGPLGMNEFANHRVVFAGDRTDAATWSTA
jgi:succinate-semialdehyde dehydrogenase/glutarate-semialdehyde dehydrogenase